MENSMNSMSKAPSINERKIDDESPDREENSTWTMYFEDFFSNIKNDDQYNEDSYYEISSSLISDADSSVAKKVADDEQIVGLSLDNRLSFKKRKTKRSPLVDNDLEETASSPAHSPKVCNMTNQLEKNPVKDITQLEKGGTSSQMDERTDQILGSNGRDSDLTELKKRGLCLVPLSMVANYLG